VSALGSLERLARELPQILRPIAGSLDDAEFGTLLTELGLRVPEGLLDGAAIGPALAAARTALTELASAAEELEDAIIAEDRARIATAATAVAAKAKAFVAAARGVADALKTDAAALASLAQAHRAELDALVRSLPSRLLGRLVVEYLDERASRAVSGLLALGVIDIVEEAGGPDGSLVSQHTRMAFSVERLVRLVTDPGGVLREVYGWGTAGFDGAALFRNVNTLLVRIADMQALPLNNPPGVDALGFRLAVDPAQSPPALDVSLRFPIDFDIDETIGSGQWEGTFKLKASFVTDLDATIRPLFDVELATPGHPGLFSVSVDVHRAAGAEPLLIGAVDGPRLELENVKLTVGLEARWDTGTGRVVLDPKVRAEITGAKLVLPELHIDRAFDFAINFSPSGGGTEQMLSRSGKRRLIAHTSQLAGACRHHQPKRRLLFRRHAISCWGWSIEGRTKLRNRSKRSARRASAPP
jgi:hypothetical protein